MNKYAIVGLGMITGPQPGRSARLLEAEAARLAIEDAGLERSQVNGAVQMPSEESANTAAKWSDAFPRILGLPINFYYSVARGGPLATLGLMTAMSFLDRGLAEYIVLAHGQDDHSRIKARRTGGGEKRSVPKMGHYGEAFGAGAAVSHHSFLASRHMQEYGTRPEHLGALAVSSRAWAQKNPRARFHGQPLTLEEYLRAPMMVDPYRRYDISMFNDGAVAFVLTTAERARDLRKPPVWVEGVGFGEQAEESWWTKGNYTRLAVKRAKEQAFKQAGIELSDIDCAMLYDCFTGELLVQLEDYGWCGKGEGGPYAAAGHIGPGGDQPVNTHGGLLSAYHFADLSGFSEAVFQLRGEAGERQLAGCKHVLVSGHGGELVSPGMCAMHSTLVLGN